tara:strand:- start:1280 stop:1777 length:498 start_codon:yes stop_codon:yes gene_type:complete
MSSIIHISPQLRIGTVIEVSGSQLVVELDRSIQDLTIQYEGTKYPIGQFGSIIKIQYGSRVIFGFVSRIQMKSDYLRELGSDAEQLASDARVLHTELFGEGYIAQQGDTKHLQYNRGVINYPLPMHNRSTSPWTLSNRQSLEAATKSSPYLLELMFQPRSPAEYQ